MKISELPRTELAAHLSRGDLLLDVFPFVIRLRSDIPAIANDIKAMYGDFRCLPPDAFSDFHVAVSLGDGVERWLRPTAYFHFDDTPIFTPLPAYQAFAMLEWGLNWCIAAHSHQYLIFHAAVIERNGMAAILPAPPGSGKSTLCAALIHRGWRLLSDELALYDIESGLMYGMARPVNLKNRSIDIIKQFEPRAIMTNAVPNTTKGTVALMRPPSESVARVAEPAQPKWIISPNYLSGAQASLQPQGNPETFLLMAEQSFNYEIHGVSAFKALGNLIDRCQCHQFTYSQLDDAISVFEELSSIHNGEHA